MTETIAENDLRRERVRQVLGKKIERKAQLEAEIKELNHSIAEIEFIWGDGLDEKKQSREMKKLKQREESKILREVALSRIKSKSTSKNRRSSRRVKTADFNPWTEAEDKKIVDVATAKGSLSLPELSLAVSSKLPGRTVGAITQHIRRTLADKGLVKVRSGGASKHGGVPTLVVEAVA